MNVPFLPRLSAACALLALTAPVPLLAADTPEPTASQPVMSGMVVSRDPQTGKLRMPTQAERHALGLDIQQALRRDTAGLREVTLPDGTVMLDLQGRFQSMSVVTLSEDGQLHMHCSDDADHLHHAMEHGAPAGKQERRDER